MRYAIYSVLLGILIGALSVLMIEKYEVRERLESIEARLEKLEKERE